MNFRVVAGEQQKKIIINNWAMSSYLIEASQMSEYVCFMQSRPLDI